MFWVLSSLQDLLIAWATSDYGRMRLNAVPRDNNVTAELTRMSDSGYRLTGTRPNSDVLARAAFSLLT